MKRDDVIAEMASLHERASLEGRDFSDEEASRWAMLKVEATAKEETVDETIIKPVGTLRPVAGAGAVRTLSEAFLADGLAARSRAQGTARLEVPIKVRALGSDQASSPAPGLTVQPHNLGVISGYYGLYGRLLDALASLPIEGSNSVTYTRLTYALVGSPPDDGNRAAKAQELTAKAESILTATDVTQVLDTWAHWLSCSRQVLDDVSGLRALLDTTLTAGLLDKIDAGVYATMTTSGNFTAYTAVADDTLGDAIARSATLLRIAGATSVKVAVNPGDLLTMSITKADSSGTYLGLPPNIPGQIVPAASVAAGKLLAWADSGAVWADREGVSVVAGLNSDDHIRNKTTLLAECRGSVLTLNPAHVLYGTALA